MTELMVISMIESVIFEVQDEIVTKYSNSIIEILKSSLKRANRKPTENMTSYEFMLMDNP